MLTKFTDRFDVHGDDTHEAVLLTLAAAAITIIVAALFVTSNQGPLRWVLGVAGIAAGIAATALCAVWAAAAMRHRTHI